MIITVCVKYTFILSDSLRIDIEPGKHHFINKKFRIWAQETNILCFRQVNVMCCSFKSHHPIIIRLRAFETFGKCVWYTLSALQHA